LFVALDVDRALAEGRQDDEQGTGLGLPIVQAILAKHDGQFLLKSKLREGTEVIAILHAKRVLQSLPAVEEDQAVARKRKSFA
ncbi:ATP-binding protein, partial [Rhizobium leguminosarum]|uniref:ATP-binding protein n=1 Tax=Rhizobium leguminosarum TaxID=384 RepID=UPI003F9B1AFA